LAATRRDGVIHQAAWAQYQAGRVRASGVVRDGPDRDKEAAPEQARTDVRARQGGASREPPAWGGLVVPVVASGAALNLAGVEQSVELAAGRQADGRLAAVWER